MLIVTNQKSEILTKLIVIKIISLLGGVLLTTILIVSCEEKKVLLDDLDFIGLEEIASDSTNNTDPQTTGKAKKSMDWNTRDDSSIAHLQGEPFSGVAYSFWADSELIMEEVMFKNGKMHGFSKVFWKNGNLKVEEVYEDGQLNGVAKGYDENGVLNFEGLFNNDELVQEIYLKSDY